MAKAILALLVLAGCSGRTVPAGLDGQAPPEGFTYKGDVHQVGDRFPAADGCNRRKPLQLRTSTTGDWQVALRPSATYAELKIASAGPKEAAAVFDDEDVWFDVAGFVVSRQTTKAYIQDELADILKAIAANPPVGVYTVSQRSPGVHGKSHDLFDAVQGVTVDLTMTGVWSISTVRNELVGLLLGRPLAQLSGLPGPYNSADTALVIRLTAVKRVDLADSEDNSKWRLVILGVVVTKSNYGLPIHRADLVVDDLSNGTALARAGATLADGCDVGTITSLPKADIIWVVDESASMDDERQDIAANANAIFHRALSSNLDFRMGVTGVCGPNGFYGCAVGKLCSKISTDPNDDGGTDRLLLPAEQAIFSSCITNPPGHGAGSEHALLNAKQAVLGHLPRAAGDPTKIRPDATLAIILATDKAAVMLNGVGTAADYPECPLDDVNQAKVDQAIQPYLDLFQGVTNPEAAAVLHVIGGVCGSSCDAKVAHGFQDLAQQLGGQMGDICKQSLGDTLQVLVDDIAAASSPIELEQVPISASLAVTMDGTEIPRSRTSGFDYVALANALVFIDVKVNKGSEVVVAYKSWKP